MMRKLRAWWLRLTVRGRCPHDGTKFVAVLYNNRPARRCPGCGNLFSWSDYG